MQRLDLDSGIISYQLGNGVLRLNPADPNLYERFRSAAEQIQAVQQELLRRLEEENADLTALLCQADRQIKQQLTLAFGADNDFDRLLGGVNVFAPGSNAQPVIVNLLALLQPVLEEGVRRWTGEQVQAAKAASKRRKALS